MTIFLCILIAIWVPLCFTSTGEHPKGLKEYPFIVIEPLVSHEYPSVVKRVQDTLNLTCTVFDLSSESEPRYNITWTTPISSSNSKNHVVIQATSSNSLNLVVPHLESRDEGEYACQAQPLQPPSTASPLPIILSTFVRVNIKNRKCSETMFACSLSKLMVCIPRRFKCDGYQDCQMGEDENDCGDSPCRDKLQCEDPRTSVVRCIPKTWCCNIKVDPNCTIREPLSCCPPFFFKSYLDERNYFANHQPHMTDITLLQTTIYTVIGCATVFTIVVTILVIAMCRVHMKRTLLTQYPASSHQSQGRAVDVWLNCGRGDLPPPPANAGLYGVTYNINNGVQIVGHAIDPPPYCEVISVPPKEGPPPPYSSREALDREREALLQQPSPPGSQYPGRQTARETCNEDDVH